MTTGFESDITPVSGTYTYLEVLDVCAEDNLNPTMSSPRKWVCARTGKPVYYDPNKEAYQKTKQEIEDEKDPILFGLIRGSDKLYFIGEWIDDICDLTFDELIEVLGEDGIDETKLNVNMYGDVEDVPCSEDNIIEEKK